MTGAFDVDALREREFPWAPRGESIYLNHASTGPIPTRARSAIAEFDARRAEPFRLPDTMLFETVRRSRELCARLIGARSTEIALMVNTTYGINVAARSLPLESGDVVVTSDREFPANIYPWMALESRGVRLERVPCVDGLPDEEGLLRALDGPGVKALTISWVGFSTGYRVDLARLGEACRERGIWFVVDAIQGVGAAAIDVSSLPIDILACGGQKWLLSPWGSGFIYVRPGLVERLEPEAVGWLGVAAAEDFSRLTDYDLTWLPDARRFEVFTLPFQDFAGMNASLELFLEVGMPAIEARVASLAGIVVEWAKGRPDAKLVTPADPARRAGVVSVRPRDVEAAAERLRKAKVSFSVREGAIRLSPHFYNTAAEVETALAAIE